MSYDEYMDDDDEWGDGFQNYKQRMRYQDDYDDDDDDDDGSVLITITLPDDFTERVEKKVSKTVSKIFKWIKS